MVQTYLDSDMVRLRDAIASWFSLSNAAESFSWTMFDLVQKPNYLPRFADVRKAYLPGAYLPSPLPALSEFPPSYYMAVITKTARTWKFKEVVKFSKACVLVNLTFQWPLVYTTSEENNEHEIQLYKHPLSHLNQNCVPNLLFWR